MNDELLPEICLNFWYFVDKAIGFVQLIAGRAYALHGSDDEKLATLRELAKSDFYIATWHPVPARYVLDNGKESIQGVTTIQVVNQATMTVYNDLIDHIEKDLPLLPGYYRPDRQNFKLNISESPLYLLTGVLESDCQPWEPVISPTGRG